MDFFNTDSIEGRKMMINDKNVEEAMGSKLIDHKLQALEFLNGKNALKHFGLLLAAANYPIKQVAEEAYRIILKMLPRKLDSQELNAHCLELLLTKIVPWVNDLATRFKPEDMGLSQEDFEITISLLNQQICECFDFFSVALDQDSLNEQVIGALKYQNYKIQISACQLVKHFYLSIEDKTLLELADLLDCLLANSTVGTKELKKHSLQAIMAIYRVFGERIDQVISRLNNPDLINQIKLGAAQLNLKEEKKLPLSRKSISQRQLLPSQSNVHQMSDKEPAKNMVKSRSSKLFTPAPVIPQNQIYNFDANDQKQASDVLLAFDDKWVKKVQIIKKEEILIEELTSLIHAVGSHPKLTYYPSVNKNFLLQLKNFLIDSNKKVASLAITALMLILRACARQVQDGFMLFYPELIEKLRSKSKQDNEVYECLIYLSSNVSLANFLRRVQKDFLEKSSVLRQNLIEILHILLTNKANYSEAELMKAGNVLTELKNFAESELTKDLSVQVRKSSEKLSSIIKQNFSEYLKKESQEVEQPQSETGARKSIAERKSVNFGSSDKITQERKSERGMAFSGAHLTESIMVPQRNQASLNPNLLPPMAPSHIQQSQFSSTIPSGRLASMRNKRKESLQERGSERSVGERQSNRSNSLAVRDESSRGIPGVSMITENTDFLTSLSLLEKQHYNRKDQINKGKLTTAFIYTASKALSDNDVDQLFVQVLRVKDDLGPSNLVSILKTIYEAMEYFPPSILRNVLPVILRFSEYNLKNNESPVAKRKASANIDDLVDSDLVLVIDYFLEFFGPMYFFEVFEETLYDKDFFQSVEAEPILSLFQGLLIKVPANLHPVSLVLSVIRGFIYFHGSPRIWNKLEELVYVVSNVYGKENFKYIKKDFEIVGLKERVVDIADWQLMTKFKNQDSLQKLGSMSFKEKMISAAQDVSLVVRNTLSSQIPKGDSQLMKDLMQICTRNFIYVIDEKDNARLMDYLVKHLADANLQIQKMALQLFVLHFNSAKTSFKFGPMFFTNFGSIMRSSNSDLRNLAINICFYVTKIESRIFKLVISDISEACEEAQEGLANLALKLMKADDRYLKSFELNSGLGSILHLLLSKKQTLREAGERLIEKLLTHFERKDFVAQINAHKIAFRKQLMEIVDDIIKRKQTGESTTSPPKSGPGNFQGGATKEFIIKNVNQITLEIAKCKSLKELKQYSENHLSPELLAELFDVNSKKVLAGISKIKEAFIENQMLAVKASIFIFKLMNLLIEAETKQNEISTQMAEVLIMLIKIRKNASMEFFKQEKWAFCEFLLALYKTKFDKKFIRKCSHLVLSLFHRPEDKESFVDLIEKCNPKLFLEHFSESKKQFGVDSNFAESNYFHQSMRQDNPRASNFSLGGDPIVKPTVRVINEMNEFADEAINQEDFYEDDGIDPNLEEFHNAIGDESSIKYEPYESPGKDQQEIPDLILKDEKNNDRKGLMSSSSSGDKEVQPQLQHTFDNRSSPVFTIPASENRNQDALDSPVFGASCRKEPERTSLLKQKSFNLNPLHVNEFDTQTRERKFSDLPPLASPAQGFGIGSNLNDKIKMAKKPALKTSASKADINIKKASTGDQHRSYDSAGVKKLHRESSKASLSRNSNMMSLGASIQFELVTFEDAIRVLSENIGSHVAEAIVILRDIVDEIDSHQVQSLIPALNNYLEMSIPPDRVMGNILDLLIEVFKNEDLEQINFRDLIRNVGC